MDEELLGSTSQGQWPSPYIWKKRGAVPFSNEEEQ